MSGENQELRKAGLKVTLPRVKIMQILENAKDRHLSAEDVYKALRDADEDVGLATVYRVLTQFEAAGLVMREPQPVAGPAEHGFGCDRQRRVPRRGHVARERPLRAKATWARPAGPSGSRAFVPMSVFP